MTAMSLPENHFLPRGEKFDAVLVCALLIVGLYVPTSFGKGTLFSGLAYILCTVLFSLLILRRGRLPSLPLAVVQLSVIPLLVLFTLTTGFNNPTLGGLGEFTALALLYMSNLRPLQFPRWLFHLYVIVNVANIALGIAILTGNELVDNFLINHYSQFYTDLVAAMLLLRKPVLTFATHSLAGFFLYLFFYMNWQTYRTKGNKLFMVLALCYLALTLAVLSNTGLVLSAVGMIQVLYDFWSSTKRKWFWTSVAAVAAVVLAFQWNVVVRFGTETVEGAKTILTFQGSGLIGRLAPTGTMYGAMHYIVNHPFAPVGLSRNDELLIADMGLIDYMIRGSVILVVWVYGGLFFFLKRNVLAKADRYFLFIAIMAFELGFSVLLYTRLPFLLAFVVVYLNCLRRAQDGNPGSGITPERDLRSATQRNTALLK